MSTLALAILVVMESDPRVVNVAYTPDRLQELLDTHAAYSLLPELDATTPEHLARGAVGNEVLAWAQTAPDTLPETTYTLYRTYRRTGDRTSYQTPYFDKREQLTQEVIRVWLTGDDGRMDQICDLIWSICEESTWVLPAHEQTEWFVDLFAAETGAELAHVLYLLGNRLPEEIRERVRVEIDRRIFTPYLAHARDHWWDSGRNNWTGVCAGSVGQTFLLLETDTARQAQALAIVLDQLDRFINTGFEPDGGCLEGVGYWNYGLLHYIGFAEMLRARTEGLVDLLASDAMKRIARYPLVVAIGKNAFASFSDSEEESSVTPFIGARLAERADAPGLLGLTGSAESWRLCVVLRNLLWWDGVTREAPPLRNEYLPQSGIAKLVGEAAGVPVVLTVRAGHNAESHNHNDVGSFILRVGNDTYLCDPGRGLYNKDYFSDSRYQNIFTNSFGHSVPRIGGALQQPGLDRRGTLEKAADNAVRIAFHEAYDIDELREAVRTLTLKDDGSVTLTDTFRFGDGEREVEEAFMTWHDVQLHGNVVRITSPEGVLEIRAAEGVFSAQSLEKECKANKRTGVLTRISIGCPAAPAHVLDFEMRYTPLH